MKLAVIGTGYVGLVSGTCFADSGNDVICVDNDPEKLRRLRNGEIPHYEPGLKLLFDRSVRENRLFFSDDLESAVKQAEVIFLCLPTPPGADGQADLSFVLQVSEQIAGVIDDYKVIVNKSTVPVGTAEKVQMTFDANSSQNVDVVSNPEFLREGAAVDDFLKPERVIIGSNSERATKVIKSLYEPFVRSGNPIIEMDPKSAELTKYAANSFLATKITFMNEIANISERVGANVDNVRRGLGSDSRIGKRFLFAGIGFGGSCFPKDVQALEYTSRQNNYDFSILKSVISVNERQKLSIIEKMKLFYNENLKGKTFGVWGLSFKPETDDVREAPSLYIVRKLLDMGANVKAYDPEAVETFKAAFGEDSSKIEFCEDQTKVLDGADALVVCTEWNEFRRPSFDRFLTRMKSPVIFDGRNLYDLRDAEEAGLTYISVGRESVNLDKTIHA